MEMRVSVVNPMDGGNHLPVISLPRESDSSDQVVQLKHALTIDRQLVQYAEEGRIVRAALSIEGNEIVIRLRD